MVMMRLLKTGVLAGSTPGQKAGLSVSCVAAGKRRSKRERRGGAVGSGEEGDLCQPLDGGEQLQGEKVEDPGGHDEVAHVRQPGEGGVRRLGGPGPSHLQHKPVGVGLGGPPRVEERIQVDLGGLAEVDRHRRLVHRNEAEVVGGDGEEGAARVRADGVGERLEGDLPRLGGEGPLLDQVPCRPWHVDVVDASAAARLIGDGEEVGGGGAGADGVAAGAVLGAEAVERGVRGLAVWLAEALLRLHERTVLGVVAAVHERGREARAGRRAVFLQNARVRSDGGVGGLDELADFLAVAVDIERVVGSREADQVVALLPDSR
eukprot:159470-Hanusia_phi.AAC.1